MAKTRKQISAEARVRRKQENKKLISKYIPIEYHALCVKMLGDENHLSKTLVYYQTLLIDTKNESLAAVSLGSPPLNQEYLGPDSVSQDASRTKVETEKRSLDVLRPENPEIKSKYLDTDADKVFLGDVMTFNDFIKLECNKNPNISTRALARMAAKEGFASLNSKTKKPGKKVGTERVQRVRNKLNCLYPS